MERKNFIVAQAYLYASKTDKNYKDVQELCMFQQNSCYTNSHVHLIS